MVDRMRRALCGSVLALALTVPAAQASPEKPVIGVVVKIGGIPWFNAMDMGIKKKAAELGVKAFMVGPTSADPALQVRAIETPISRVSSLSAARDRSAPRAPSRRGTSGARSS